MQKYTRKHIFHWKIFSMKIRSRRGVQRKSRNKKPKGGRGLSFDGKYFPMKYMFSGVFLHADSEYRTSFA
jgi:hypothetical protein